MRPIDADTLKEKIVKLCRNINANKGITIPTLTFTRIIDNAPTVPQLTVFAENADEKAVADLKAELQSVIESDSGLHGEWVPISKRLPEEDGIYLVTLEYVEDSEIVYETDMAKFVYSEKDDCNNGFHKAYTVIAWRPSPEPYEKGGAE